MTTHETESGRRIGELAAASGLTVRTLHHYDDIGLLAASERTPAGHRVYTDADVERLYRVRSLRRLGLTLGEIAGALDESGHDLRSTMARHLAAVEQRIEAEARLRNRLAQLVGTTDADPTTDDILRLLEEMNVLDTTMQRRISILVYADLDAAYTFLIDVFGLGAGQLTRDDAGNVVHGELQAGDGVVWLHPESPEFGLASPRSLGAASASMALMVDDVDAHFRHASSKGATIAYEPVDQPYGYREYSARDSEGGLWSFMKALD